MIDECNILRKLPDGGQKTVFLAEHKYYGEVVIKKGPIKSFTSLERIKREVELLAELNSEYYPKQYHFNIDVKTKEFEIVEEYITGNTLRDSMSKFRSSEQILKLIDDLTSGLSIIWEKNIVHRDLKPENIIIRPNGKPSIIDLGIARFLDLEALTKTISPIGPCTPIYASPEQLTNKKDIIDPRTDFFALGIVALELYLGNHPFDPKFVGDKYSIVENILLNKFVVENVKVKPDFKILGFVNKTLQTQPYNRFRNYKMLKDFIKHNL